MLSLQAVSRSGELLNAALELSCSTRPQDCNTAAYLLRLLIKHPRFAEPLKATCDQNAIDCDVEMLKLQGSQTRVDNVRSIVSLVSNII